MSKIYPIAIGRSAQSTAPSTARQFRRQQTGKLWPLVDGQPFTRRLIRIDGVLHELALWIPGPHPENARWWEELSMWWTLRPVSVAPLESNVSAITPRSDSGCGHIDVSARIAATFSGAY